jgi:hypothetical protein
MTWQYRPDTNQSSRRNWISFSDMCMGYSCICLTIRDTPSGHGLVMEAFSVILKRRLQLTIRTLGQAIRTPSSILIITFCSNIGLGWNWCHWKANKKWYNLTIQTAKRNVRMHAQSLNLCWCSTPNLSWNRICKAYIKRALGMYYVQNSVVNSL